MKETPDNEISARIERLLTAQPTAPPQARRVRRSFVIEKMESQGPLYISIEVRVDEEFAEAYRRPGQYVTLKLSGWPARFYVIASRPETDRWEFLVERKGELGPALAALSPGDEVLVSIPEGVGFDPVEARGKVATLFCTGSGVATMRSLIEEWLAADEEHRPRQMVLYYGEVDWEDFAYQKLLDNWESRGVQVYRAVEEQTGDRLGFRYVQHAFDHYHPEMEDAFVYLSGAPVMIQMVAQKLLRLGVATPRVKINI